MLIEQLVALYPILAVYGPQALQPVVLTLLIYTITLHLAIKTSFLRDHPIVSEFLHAIPFLGTSCMAGIALVSHLQSPAIAVLCLFLGIFPLVIIAVHEGILRAEVLAAELPVQMQHLPAPAVPEA